MLNRKRQRSQRVTLDQAPTDALTDTMVDETDNIILHKTKYPKSPWLHVDTSEPMELALEKSLAYLENVRVKDK